MQQQTSSAVAAGSPSAAGGLLLRRPAWLPVCWGGPLVVHLGACCYLCAPNGRRGPQRAADASFSFQRAVLALSVLLMEAHPSTRPRSRRLQAIARRSSRRAAPRSLLDFLGVSWRLLRRLARLPFTPWKALRSEAAVQGHHELPSLSLSLATQASPTTAPSGTAHQSQGGECFSPAAIAAAIAAAVAVAAAAVAVAVAG
ncbi:hypothetical protein Emag_002342 [Eimeria magna]